MKINFNNTLINRISWQLIVSLHKINHSNLIKLLLEKIGKCTTEKIESRNPPLANGRNAAGSPSPLSRIGDSLHRSNGAAIKQSGSSAAAASRINSLISASRRLNKQNSSGRDKTESAPSGRSRPQKSLMAILDRRNRRRRRRVPHKAAVLLSLLLSG